MVGYFAFSIIKPMTRSEWKLNANSLRCVKNNLDKNVSNSKKARIVDCVSACLLLNKMHKETRNYCTIFIHQVIFAKRQRRDLSVFESSCHLPTCLPHTAEASLPSFLFWSENRTRVFWFSCRRFTYWKQLLTDEHDSIVMTCSLVYTGTDIRKFSTLHAQHFRATGSCQQPEPAWREKKLMHRVISRAHNRKLLLHFSKIFFKFPHQKVVSLFLVLIM